MDALIGSTTPRLRAASRFMAAVAAALLLAGTVAPTTLMAEEDGAGPFDAISDLFSRPDNGTVNVPKRRQQSPESRAPAGGPAAAGQAPDPPPPAAVPAPATVSVPKRRSSGPAAAPTPATVSVPKRQSSGPAAAPTPGTGSVREGQARPASGPAAGPAEEPELSEGVNPAHVFRATEDLLSEIEVLRAGLAIFHFPPQAELIDGRAPVHVYVKSLEVLAKVIQMQRRMGLPTARMGQLPVKVMDSADVLDHVEYILREVRGIRTQMAIDGPVEFAPLQPGSTSSMNYRNLADASLMLDGLIGTTLTPADVYRNALSILDELSLVAAVFNVSLSFEPPPIEGEVASADVAAQILRATYKAINLQTRLQMESSTVPEITLVRVSPSENYDATNLLLAEIARIKVHLGITLAHATRPNLPMDQQSKDVFALVVLIARNIDRVAAAVGN